MPILTGVTIPGPAPTHPGNLAAGSPHHSRTRWQKAQLAPVVSVLSCLPAALLGSSCTTEHTQMWMWPRKWLTPRLLRHSPASRADPAKLTISGLHSDFWLSGACAVTAWGLEKESFHPALTSFLLQTFKNLVQMREYSPHPVFSFL